MVIDLRSQPVADLAEHITISSSFDASVVYDAHLVVADGSLVERRLSAPMRKDYDALEHPLRWLEFDVSNWVLFGAFAEGRRVGGIIAAVDTPGVDLLEGRSDLVVLWDVRVAPEARGAGIGTALFHAAEAWAFARGCRELKVETQNVNVAACRLYRRNGCTLSQAVPGVYAELPDEVQLIWRKPIDV